MTDPATTNSATTNSAGHGQVHRLTREDAAYVARLARIDLDPEELDTFAVQLAAVLDHAAQGGLFGDQIEAVAGGLAAGAEVVVFVDVLEIQAGGQGGLPAPGEGSDHVVPGPPVEGEAEVKSRDRSAG